MCEASKHTTKAFITTFLHSGRCTTIITQLENPNNQSSVFGQYKHCNGTQHSGAECTSESMALFQQLPKNGGIQNNYPSLRILTLKSFLPPPHPAMIANQFSFFIQCHINLENSHCRGKALYCKKRKRKKENGDDIFQKRLTLAQFPSGFH